MKASIPEYRVNCPQCRKAQVTCYCSAIRAFESRFQFVILIHRDEARNAIATGRMASLILKNSILIQGHDFSENEVVNRIVGDPANYPVVLYPGPASVNLSKLTPAERQSVFPADKRVVVFVIDGTWSKAKIMRRLSSNLRGLPQISFNPRAPSNFRVRKQPRAECLSTIEAIHEVIDLVEPEGATREHDNLITVFTHMVDTQLVYTTKFGKGARRRQVTSL